MNKEKLKEMDEAITALVHGVRIQQTYIAQIVDRLQQLEKKVEVKPSGLVLPK